MPGRVLVAEDDPKQAELIRRYLDDAGFAVVVVHDGRAALEAARHRQPDLVVLDVMMPSMDGLDVCRVLRYETDIPVIMLTARSTEDDLLLALDIGADDYLTKPYSPRELVARVRTVLRRAGLSDDGLHTVRVGDLEIDPRRHELRRSGELIEVTPKEFAILYALAADPGRAFSRLDIVQQAFGFEYEGLERTVDVHIANLRRKIEPDPSEPRYVLTVFGKGYRLAEEVRV